MNYIKYSLKDSEELQQVLKTKDNIFVVACNKCFKEFDTFEEPDCAEFMKLAEAEGKTITGSLKLDFLCNKTHTEADLKNAIPEGTENIFVIACGLGIQTVAELEELPVMTATDSLNYIGYHGMALTKKTCGACAQCYLNMTGGICPIVDCSKSLVNGQCGGAKNGKCEIDPMKDCAWEKIERRLAEQGRLDDLRLQPVQLRDYSKTGIKVIKEYVAEIRAKRFEGFYGGVHPEENKQYTEHLALKAFPEPDTVIIPLSMHVGKPAEPIVKVGDEVKVGQLIAEASGFISCNVHSSVSGTVTAIEPHTHPNKGPGVMSIVIKSDHKDTLDESVKPNKDIDELTPDEIIDIVRDKGITGMGGAGFPTYVKLKPGKPIDYVIINGSECEPYLTADHRTLLEFSDDVVYGTRALLKAVNAPKGYILIEDNKPDAIALLQEKTAGIDNIEIVAAKTQYPEGAEKMLIKRVVNRKVPSGGLPADVGCVVSNASTAKAVADAIKLGMPLIRRAVSVTGERIKTPGNYLIPIGTDMQSIIDYCGGIIGDDATVKAGGMMMGAVLKDTHVPIIKGSNGVIAVNTDHVQTMECIKCGRCVDVCPMELSPMKMAQYTDANQPEKLLELNIRDCFSCRCCEYICSSKIPLVDKINKGKQLIMPLLKK